MVYYWVACGNPGLKWAYLFFSPEKLQFLRKIAYTRAFKLLTRFIHKMTLLVAMFAVPGSVHILESVFYLNFKPFGANDFPGERIRIFKNWFTLSMPRQPSMLSIHA